MFFKNHRCNDICKHLKQPTKMCDIGHEPARRTSYRSELVRASVTTHAQVGGTCYANAVATVVRAAESRIVGRSLEGHAAMVNRIVAKYGSNGGVVRTVLKQECESRQLLCEEVDEQRARDAIDRGRAVVCTFHLSDEQWAEFSSFFRTKPSKVLSNISAGNDGAELHGHAVVILGRKGNVWQIKNSWGSGFAHKGYFMVRSDALRFSYFDVVFTEQGLTQADRDAYYRDRKQKQRLGTRFSTVASNDLCLG